MGMDWVIRLPTEWEWQQGATGGQPENAYPWGKRWDGRLGNTSQGGIGRATAVGMFPHGASVVGALDMSGNILEWCLNEHKNPEKTVLDSSRARSMRGGAFRFPYLEARCDFRKHNLPDNVSDHFGFRVCCGPLPI